MIILYNNTVLRYMFLKAARKAVEQQKQEVLKAKEAEAAKADEIHRMKQEELFGCRMRRSLSICQHKDPFKIAIYIESYHKIG